MYNRIPTFAAALLAVLVFLAGGSPPAFAQGKGLTNDDGLPVVVKFEGKNPSGQLLFAKDGVVLSGAAPVVGQDVTIELQWKCRGDEAKFKPVDHELVLIDLNTRAETQVLPRAQSSAPKMEMKTSYIFRKPGPHRLEWRMNNNVVPPFAAKREFTVVADPKAPLINNPPAGLMVSIAPVTSGQVAEAVYSVTDKDGDPVRVAWVSDDALPTIDYTVASVVSGTATASPIKLLVKVTATPASFRFRFVAYDGKGGFSAPHVVDLVIRPVPAATNKAPIITSLTAMPVIGGQVASVEWGATDEDGDKPIITVYRPKSTVAIITTSTSPFDLATPVVQELLVVAFPCVVTDGKGGRAERVLEVTSLPAPDQPDSGQPDAGEPKAAGTDVVIWELPNLTKRVLDADVVPSGPSNELELETKPDGTVIFKLKSDGKKVQEIPPGDHK